MIINMLSRGRSGNSNRHNILCERHLADGRITLSALKSFVDDIPGLSPKYFAKEVVKVSWNYLNWQASQHNFTLWSEPHVLEVYGDEFKITFWEKRYRHGRPVITSEMASHMDCPFPGDDSDL